MPEIYYSTPFAASLVFACAATAAVAWGLVRGRAAAALMVVAVTTLIVAGRWPTPFIPAWLNPDESMMLAQALKFTTDPVPWRSIDPGTGGPFNSYALLPLHWLGMDIGYPLARVTAIACLSAYLSLMFLAMRRVAGVAAAALAVLPAATMHAVGSSGDATHYSSEMASLLSIGLLAFVASRLAAERSVRADLAWSFATGVCAFVVTMSKLQGVPLGAAVSLSIVALVSPSPAVFARRIAAIAAGAAVAAAGLVALLAATGVLQDFRISFLELPMTYASTPYDYAQTMTFVRGSTEMRGYTQALAWLVGFSLMAVPFWLRSERPLQWLLRAAAFALVLYAIFLTLSQPGRGFPHYLAYLSVAGCWLWLLVLPWSRNVRGAEAGHVR